MSALQAHVQQLGLEQLPPQLFAVLGFGHAGALRLGHDLLDRELVLLGDALQSLVDLGRSDGDLGLRSRLLQQLFVDDFLQDRFVDLGDGGVALGTVRHRLLHLQHERLGATLEIAEQNRALTHRRHDALDHGGVGGGYATRQKLHRARRERAGAEAGIRRPRAGFIPLPA